MPKSFNALLAAMPPERQALIAAKAEALRKADEARKAARKAPRRRRNATRAR